MSVNSDRVSRQLLARVWKAGAGPGDSPLTIDLDSTICETYGLAKEGARHHGYTGARGYHPLLAVAAGTGDVLMARLARGPGPTPPAALPTSCVKRWGGCATAEPGANSRCGPTAASIPTPWSPSAAGWMSASPSPIRQCARLRNLIEAIPEDAWTPIPYCMDGAADVAETTYTPFQAEADAAPVRLIVRRVKPAPGSQLALFATYSYHGFITDRDGGDAGTGGRSSPSRRDRKCDTRPQVRRGAEPSPLGPLRRQRRLAGGTGDGAQPGPLDSPHRPGSADRDHQDPQTTGLCLGRTDHPLGTPIDPASSPALALGGAVQPRPGPTASHSTPSLTEPVHH